jgi:hypothetical protein
VVQRVTLRTRASNAASTAIPAPQVHHSRAAEPDVVTVHPPASPPPGFSSPQGLSFPPPSGVQDTVLQDAPAPPAVAPPPRWSGKRTAAMVAAALALTSAGAIAAAAATSNGVAAPSEQRAGGPGPGGPNWQLGPGPQQSPGVPPAPGQQGFGPGRGRSGR